MDSAQSYASLAHEPIYRILHIFLGDEAMGILGIEKMDFADSDTAVPSYKSVTMWDIVSKSGTT